MVVIFILLGLWLLGVLADVASGLIHLLLVAVAVLLLIRFINMSPRR